MVCLQCISTLVKASVPHRSLSCDEEVDETIELEQEGTGFAAGGLAEATKLDVAFQGRIISSTCSSVFAACTDSAPLAALPKAREVCAFSFV